MTTAPREIATLERSLASLQAAGWRDVRVFADGDCTVPDGFDVTRRLPASGAFANWWLSLQELVQRQPLAKWYALFQDDVLLCRGARRRVEQLEFTGVVSLYQSSHHRLPVTTEFRGGGGFVGALALVFDREAAHAISSSDLGTKHRQRRERQNDWIDGAIGKWCQQNGIPLWVHAPSLAQHIGDTSTLGHHEQPSKTFPGESFDASSLPAAKLQPRPRRKRLGLVGFNTAQGLGYVNRDAAKWLEVDDWLITQHARFPMLDRPQTSHQLCESKMSDDEIRERLQGLDVVMWAETCPGNLPRVAQSMGIRTVCVPMVEWLPVGEEWTNHVDMWIAPTLHSFNQLIMLGIRGRVEYTPWPIDTSQFTYRQRFKAERFLFAHGNGGPYDRKGGRLLAEAAAEVPDMPLIVYSQENQSGRAEPVQWPEHVEFRGEATSPADLYADGDVFILPSRWEGLGLQLYECQAAGMPLITTGAPPMVEANPWRTMPPKPRKARLTHEFPSWTVRPSVIAEAMRDAFGADIAAASQQARDWVVRHRDWSKQADLIRALLEG